jgi:hypothetical protein
MPRARWDIFGLHASADLPPGRPRVERRVGGDAPSAICGSKDCREMRHRRLDSAVSELPAEFLSRTFDGEFVDPVEPYPRRKNSLHALDRVMERLGRSSRPLLRGRVLTECEVVEPLSSPRRVNWVVSYLSCDPLVLEPLRSPARRPRRRFAAMLTGGAQRPVRAVASRRTSAWRARAARRTCVSFRSTARKFTAA